jgi:uncharacterized protein YebE (UPF0316 family)
VAFRAGERLELQITTSNKGKKMAKLVQTITMKVKGTSDHAKSLEVLKKIKAAMAPHGIGVSAHLSIEAGPASGYVTVSYQFPSAVKWGELVDSNKDTLQRLRQEILTHADVASTSLLQEIEL